KKLIAYDGFEPSGKIHVAQGIMRAINIQKMIQAGIHFKMLIADWHAYANNKMGGDLNKIKKTGQYFIEVWKACGLETGAVEFIWASDLVKDSNYWLMVLKIARATTLKRIIRCSQIMGRSESDNLSAAQIIYPAMQAADIFYLKADIAQLGMDQRKVNMLARQLASELGFEKPAAIHHHMLMSLNPPIKKSAEGDNQDKIEKTILLKMSKSIPDSAIFMTDSKEEISNKILKAYCPPEEKESNPILEYFKFIVFAKYQKVEIQRENKFGGNINFDSYGDLEGAYIRGKIYPLDLKNNLITYLDSMIEPVRMYFESHAGAKKLKEEVESYEITR
ncbi:tyrosine--tRNA ligase, partial [Patescibacteria group bacterium]|nr:tyrosine--tRNA ligase [Patescibacteria group bacterium]